MFAFKKKTNHLEKIWFEDVTELINKKNIFTIIPQKNFTTNQNINAVMRLSIIISIILVILYRKVEYLFIVVCTMIGSYVYNTITIKEFFPDTQDIYKASFAKPYNPLGNKLIGESYDKYMNTEKCEVCQNNFTSSKDKCLDHDHETKVFRFILCRDCNNYDNWKDKIN